MAFFFVIVKLLRIMTGLTSPEHAGLEKLFTNKKQMEWFAVHTEVFIRLAKKSGIFGTVGNDLSGIPCETHFGYK